MPEWLTWPGVRASRRIIVVDRSRPAAKNGRMTRFVVDPLVAIKLAREKVLIAEPHKLVAPNILRSQCLGILFRGVRAGGMESREASTILDGITSLRRRLLGDRVSRAVAWRIAEQMDWDDTANAEYLAVTQLQADAFITLDPERARQAKGVEELAPFEALLE